jgi:hypothetical protein
MSSETVKFDNPLLHEEGMGEEQQMEAIGLLKVAREARGKVRDSDARWDRLYSSPWGEHRANGAMELQHSVSQSLLERRERRALKGATKDYKANEGAYQVQAVHDAAADGVETNFGTDHDTNLGRSEQKAA